MLQHEAAVVVISAAFKLNGLDVALVKLVNVHLALLNIAWIVSP